MIRSRTAKYRNRILKDNAPRNSKSNANKSLCLNSTGSFGLFRTFWFYVFSRIFFKIAFYFVHLIHQESHTKFHLGLLVINLSKHYASLMTVECEICRAKFYDFGELRIHRCTQTTLDETAEYADQQRRKVS